ncbi:VOC family protein [Nostocoides vanveenii]|jgi:predicted enzyme related to lactoylglutathione lyase|uniref:VOC domain-containing protein n=1 Tax=Nostocoides vanveenii TaxID=330835 RepID=A0ABN2K248_9MICO
MPSVWTSYLAADSADACAAAVTAAGGTLMMPAFDVGDVGRMFVAVDPSGAAFGVWEAKAHTGAGVFNEDGAYCWKKLHTLNYDAARDFYAKAFGYSFTDIGGDGFTYCVFALDGGGPESAIGGVADDANTPGAEMPYWLTWFQADDADAMVAKVEQLGGSVIMPADTSPFGRMAIVTGPEGEVFGIIDPTTTLAMDEAAV